MPSMPHRRLLSSEEGERDSKEQEIQSRSDPTSNDVSIFPGGCVDWGQFIEISPLIELSPMHPALLSLPRNGDYSIFHILRIDPSVLARLDPSCLSAVQRRRPICPCSRINHLDTSISMLSSSRAYVEDKAKSLFPKVGELMGIPVSRV
ncbi:hypothetical protein KM043_007965 [Ampulex compressa]|nr:hypothetical protein KM043_007965 [Ampulex compressa]